MNNTGMRMRARNGFTLLEVLVVLMIAGIVMAMVIPRMSAGMADTSLQRSATVIAADFQLAHSMAARQRRPVRISIDAANRQIRILDHVTPTRIYSQRLFTTQGDNPVSSMETTDALVIIYPNGLTDGPVDVTIRAPGKRRIISMTRAGQVRIAS